MTPTLVRLITAATCVGASFRLREEESLHYWLRELTEALDLYNAQQEEGEVPPPQLLAHSPE